MTSTLKSEMTGKRRSPASKARRRLPVFAVLARVPLLVWSLLVIYPLLWMILSSFKSNAEIYRSPWALPETFSFENFIRAWTDYDVPSGLFNSAIVTLIGTLLSLLFAVPAAYALGRIRFRGSKALYLLFLGSMTIPTVLGLIPLFFMLADLNMLNNLFGLSLVYAATRLPFTIFLLTGFMSGIPKEMEEAAAIDGVSRYRLLWQVIVPVMKPALITVAVMNAVTFWNEYFMALIFIPDARYRTIGVVLDYMNKNAQYSNDWGGLFAALTLSVVPVIVVYALLQKQIIRGMLDGAIKD